MSTISASTTTTTAYKVTADTTGTLVLQTGSTPTTAVTIDTSQNVGVGTASPTGKLSVAGNITLEPGGSGPVASSRPQLWRGADGFLGIQSGGDTGGVIGFYTSSSGTPSERMRLDASGYLGVGQTTPIKIIDAYSTGASTAIVRVQGTTNYAIFQAQNTSGAFQVGVDNSAGGGFGVGAYSRVLYSDGAYPMVFFTNSTERARIDSSGRFMVGQTSSSYTFAVTGTCYISNTVSGSYNTSSNSTLGIFGMNTNGAVDNGRVCNIEWKMNGDAQGQFWYANYITQGGSRTLGAYCTGTAWTNSSDIANKENITPIKYGLETVMASRPVDFDWKSMRDEAGKGRADIGFIAQEMELLVPEVVTGQEGGKGISYGNLVAIAFKAIQEQQAIIETLTNRITALEAK